MEEDEELLGPQRMIRRSELLRIIAQCLCSLGYEEAVECLELESGITCESWEFQMLEGRVMKGNWEHCIEILDLIPGLTSINRYKALLGILEEVFSETKHLQGPAAARIAVMEIGSKIGSQTSNSLFNALYSPGHLWNFRIRDTGFQNTRRNLVSALKPLMPSPIILPERRLERLLEIALHTQAENCPYHVMSAGPMSLYSDHDCEDKFPKETIQVLNEVGQEVKFIQFSNKGEYLASTLENGSVLIWKVLDDNTVLQEHEINTGGPISFVSWSPDDSLLLIQLSENYISSILRLWDVEKATFRHSFADVYVQCCAWLPSSRVFVGVCEQEEIILKINCDTLETVPLDCKVGSIRNLSVTNRWGNWTFVWLSGDREIRIYSYPSDSCNIISETHDITSLSLSVDGYFLIVNIKNHEIHMWHLGGGWIQPVSFKGHRHQLCNVQSCFGGSDRRFIASGSEDSQVYIWNCCAKLSTVAVLSGHSNSVKCVTWNPRRPQMLASLSADSTIRIWGVKHSE